MLTRKKSGYVLWLWVVQIVSGVAWSQQISSFDRDRVESMLRDISPDIKKHYYDPKFHGVDWDAKVAETKALIEKAPSLNMAISHVAAALDSLNDSHTFLLPPSRPYRHDYGWIEQMVGDHCYVTHVRPGTDAAAKGLMPGDEILAINGFAPTRDNLWKMDYVYRLLRPQPGLRLVLKDHSGKERQVDVMANHRETKRVLNMTGSDGGSDIWNTVREMENEEHMLRGRAVTLGDDLVVLKMPEFVFSDSEISNMMGKVGKHKLILDLRGNPGGSVETLRYLLGYFVEKDVKIADRVTRVDTKPVTVKTHPHDLYSEGLIVLVDSKSASASEVFARVVQIEKRGLVFGDHTSGSVMEAKHYSYKVGTDTVVFFGASITDADLIMADGKSLEHTGVTPDETILPTAEDLANGRDPVLARAAEKLGAKLSPEAAGKLMPFEWPRE